ncbi:MAG: 2-amino-4-hydroxy-6-hydroxymethyldihydropteridine diphosphokinase [Bacteroidia bacterium]|nr:2-amino-4-hydroxy-6-hydroxymethyldihydropteridine diphosphokinase [Bacteroidia bacterium]MDW8014961.1 2-amino-4-hydroxy-6-hydroxymethyldihydropteridine diphosphokinase [Bacteroidia bacterium]
MIFIGVGSNLGGRWEALMQAWRLLERFGVRVRGSSPVYETRPWGVANQPFYLNAVWEVQTELSPEALLYLLKKVEEHLGRPSQLSCRWGARIIDLDLLTYGAEERSTPTLMLPHPWIPYRPFVLGPWNDLAPYFYLRKWGATIAELWQRCYAVDWGYRVNPPPSIVLPPILSLPIPPAGRPY